MNIQTELFEDKRQEHLLWNQISRRNSNFNLKSWTPSSKNKATKDLQLRNVRKKIYCVGKRIHSNEVRCNISNWKGTGKNSLQRIVRICWKIEKCKTVRKGRISSMQHAQWRLRMPSLFQWFIFQLQFFVWTTSKEKFGRNWRVRKSKLYLKWH